MTEKHAAVVAVIRDFDFADYGLDDIAYGIEADPEAQEWIPDLAVKILAALGEQTEETP